MTNQASRSLLSIGSFGVQIDYTHPNPTAINAQRFALADQNYQPILIHKSMKNGLIRCEINNKNRLRDGPLHATSQF